MSENAAEWVSIDKLQPWRDNPRNNNSAIDKIADSIKRFGFAAPIVARKADGMIIAGHTRFAAATKLHLKKVPVRYMDLDPADAKLLSIADNKLAEISDWSFDALKNILETEAFSPEDINIAGFDFDSADDLITNLNNQFLNDSNDSNDFDSADLSEPSADLSADEDVRIFEDDDIIDDAFSFYRTKGFPYPDLETFQMKQQINKIANLDFNRCRNSSVGNRIADTFHSHRFETSAINMCSPYESFDDDVKLRKALKMDYQGGSIKKGRIGFLRLVNGTQACANFRPAFARMIYDKYAKSGDVVFDSSTGFGGRLVGFLSSCCKKYIGVDPNTKTHEANQKLFDTLKNNGKKLHLVNLPAEDLLAEIKNGKHQEIISAANVSFTSPPYFKKEIYSDEDTQSCNRYTEYDSWIDGFLFPMMELNFLAVKEGGIAIVNIEDVKISGKSYSLVDKTIEAGEAAGFKFTRKEIFPLPNRTFMKNNEKVSIEAFESVLFFEKD